MRRAGRLPAARAPLLRARRARDGDRLLRRGPRRLPAPRGRASGGRRSSSTASSRTRPRSTSTRSATAARCGSAGSCSTSRRPACTPATAPACCRRTRSARRCSSRSARPRARSRSRSASSGCSTSSTRSHAGELYVIEANPRASRTVPFVSKAIGLPLAKLACRIMLGERDRRRSACRSERQGLGFGDHVSVKEAVLPFDRFEGSDALLGPEMRSTGEVMGIARDFPTAFAKAQAAAGVPLPQRGHRLHHRHRLRQGRRLRGRPEPARQAAFGSSPRAAPPRRSRAWACPCRRSTRSARARRTCSTGSSAATSTSSSTPPPASARAPTAMRSAAPPSPTASPA